MKHYKNGGVSPEEFAKRCDELRNEYISKLTSYDALLRRIAHTTDTHETDRLAAQARRTATSIQRTHRTLARYDIPVDPTSLAAYLYNEVPDKQKQKQKQKSKKH